MILLIKADKRPKKCDECKGWYKCEGWEEEPYTCPIIGELPDKHGRLIDVDKLLEAERGKVLQIKDPSDVEVFRELYDRIAKAPTVLEASED